MPLFTDPPASYPSGWLPAGSTEATCPECSRVFDLTDEEQAEEYAYGHDCEDD